MTATPHTSDLRTHPSLKHLAMLLFTPDLYPRSYGYGLRETVDRQETTATIPHPEDLGFQHWMGL